MPTFQQMAYSICFLPYCFYQVESVSSNISHQPTYITPTNTHHTNQHTSHQPTHITPTNTHHTNQHTSHQPSHITPTNTHHTNQHTSHQPTHITSTNSRLWDVMMDVFVMMLVVVEMNNMCAQKIGKPKEHGVID